MSERLTTPTGVLAVAIAAACLLGVPKVQADSKSTDALERQVQELSRQVGTLVQRVHVLEGNLAKLKAVKTPPAQPAAPAVQPAAAPAAAAPATVPAPTSPAPAAAAAVAAPQPPTPAEAWKKVEEGMTEEQITGLLGAPSAKFKLGGQTVWYYNYPGVGSGSIAFYDDGHVASSQSPPGVTIWHW